MNNKLPDRRFRLVLSLLGVALLIGAGWAIFEQGTSAGRQAGSGTLEKLAVSSGNIVVEIDMNKLNGVEARPQISTSRFAVNEGMFRVLVFNGEMRTTLPSAMEIVAETELPLAMEDSRGDLVIEAMMSGSPYELVLRNGKTGFPFFNIEGHIFEYAPATRVLSMSGGHILVSDEYAAQLGRPALAGSPVGTISLNTKMRVIEVTQLADGEVQSTSLPPSGTDGGTVPGPDVIVGELTGLAQFPSGVSFNGHVGLAVGTDACNAGTIALNWLANPVNDHPVIPQNMYRMSGGVGNTERFEQIGQSSMKHAFTALSGDTCGFGCNGSGGGTTLASGCSDPYSAGLNSGPNLGSRAWVNPFTGFYPRNDSSTPNNSHTGHNHNANQTMHRILTPIADLDTTLNPGAIYFAEAQYVTPHEYQWCQSHPGQCNMNNNVSYERQTVSGTTSFTFSPVGTTVREQPAINAWTGSIRTKIEPQPGIDGSAWIAYKVTDMGGGVWHYEYAIYNQNLDRSIQSFALPVGTISNVGMSNFGFHAPPQHPGSLADGTFGSAGYSSMPWTAVQTATATTWSSETFAQNLNANAIRWGTLYNFRFNSTRPPIQLNATIGFFKTGGPVAVPVLAPAPNSPCTAREARFCV